MVLSMYNIGKKQPTHRVPRTTTSQIDKEAACARQITSKTV